MWLRLRSISSVPTMLTNLLRSRGIGIAHSRPEECLLSSCPALGASGPPLPRLPIRFVRKRIRPSICRNRRLPVLKSARFHCDRRCWQPTPPPPSRPGGPGEQKPMLIFEALQPTRRNVVLASRRGLVRFWFSRKSFPHLVVLPARILWLLPMNAPGTPIETHVGSSILMGIHPRPQLMFSRLPVLQRSYQSSWTSGSQES